MKKTNQESVNQQRRAVLKRAAVSGVAASLPFSASAAVTPDLSHNLHRVFDQVQRAEFVQPDFAAVLDETVLISAQNGQQYVGQVASVDDMHFTCTHHQRPNYLHNCAKVVRFKVVNAQQLSNDVYQVQHVKLGQLDLLLSAVPDAQGQWGLEAVFN